MSLHIEPVNPYYYPETVGLQMHTLEAPQPYEFDIIAFWAIGDGRVYSAQDSGCSCPSPFEDYCGTTIDEVIQKFEQVESVEHAARLIKEWNRDYRDTTKVDSQQCRDCENWVKEQLKI